MPLWGNSTSDESRPKWLRAGDKPANDLNECFADERGWVIRHADGNEEVLCAIGGLAGAGSTTAGLGNATIVRVYFGATGYSTSSTGTVYVQYNEKVDVKNLAATLNVTDVEKALNEPLPLAHTIIGVSITQIFHKHPEPSLRFPLLLSSFRQVRSLRSHHRTE